MKTVYLKQLEKDFRVNPYDDQNTIKITWSSFQSST